MRNQRWRQNQWNRRGMTLAHPLGRGRVWGFTGVLGLLGLLLSPLAWAEYQPNPESKPPSSRGYTAGTRNGCAGTAQAALTAIAPHGHVGQTTSTRPQLFWYVPEDQPRAIEVRVYGAPLSTQYRQSVLGFQALPLTAGQALTTGKTYIWQVALLCNPNRPSQALVAEAELQVVALPPPLARRLASVTDPILRSQLYASAGFWYDALAEVLPLDTAAAKQATLALLQDLATLELQPPDGSRPQGERLQQIIQTLQPPSKP